MSEQLTFELPVLTGFGRDDFFVSDANSVAVAAIENWADWPQQRLILSGAKGAGKTHLAKIWAKAAQAKRVSATDHASWPLDNWQVSAICVEDVHAIQGDRTAQSWLFHVYNMCDQANVPLLLTGRANSKDWADSVPDLASRLASMQVVELGSPDDALMAALMVKLFEDRQLAPDTKAIQYLIPRIERSFAAVQNVVSWLDSEALKRGKPISVPLARDVLNEIENAKDS